MCAPSLSFSLSFSSPSTISPTRTQPTFTDDSRETARAEDFGMHTRSRCAVRVFEYAARDRSPWAADRADGSKLRPRVPSTIFPVTTRRVRRGCSRRRLKRARAPARHVCLAVVVIVVVEGSLESRPPDTAESRDASLTSLSPMSHNKYIFLTRAFPLRPITWPPRATSPAGGPLIGRGKTAS